MPEHQPKAPDPTSESHDSSVRLNLDGSLKVFEAQPDRGQGDSALLDSAVFNLNIAQQYIDESKHLVEHRLICFHYAVALLARHRSTANKPMLGLARQCFLQAANWRFENAADLEDAHDRIVCESYYNLGVIDELEGRFKSAKENYDRAVEIATRRGQEYAGVEILAAFGGISADIRITEAQETQPNTDSHKEILRRIDLLTKRIAAENLGPEGKAPAAGAYQPPEPPKVAKWLNALSVLLGKTIEPGTSKAASPPPGSQQPLRINITLTLVLDKLAEFAKQLNIGKPDSTKPGDLDEHTPPISPSSDSRSR